VDTLTRSRIVLGWGVTDDQKARQAILLLLKDNPRQSAADIARQAGVSRQRVHQILHDMGYELVVYWRKVKG
jgi:predicted ArsR family transcriptional regulator